MFFSKDGFGLPFRVIALCLALFLCLPSHSHADGGKAKGVVLCALGAVCIGLGIAASQDKGSDKSDNTGTPSRGRQYEDRSDELFPPTPSWYPAVFYALGAVSMIAGVSSISKAETPKPAGNDPRSPGEGAEDADAQLVSAACVADAGRPQGGSECEEVAASPRIGLGIAPVRGGVLAGIQVRF